MGGGYPACTIHSMQEVGLATTTKVNIHTVRTDEKFRVREKAGNSERGIYTPIHPGVKYALQGRASTGNQTRIQEKWGFTSGGPRYGTP